MWFKKKRVYLDYAAATPVLPEVKAEMERYWSRDFYNPNAIYEEATKIKTQITGYKVQMAKILGVAKENIIFTSGGTEANVLAVRGVKLGKVVTEGDVHPSITEAIRQTDSQEIVLISSVATDNKLGRKIREERKKNNSKYPLLHIDASQSAQYFNIGLETLACDLLTLDAAKIYGPKGIGALVVKPGTKIDLPPMGTPAVPLIAGFVKALEIVARDRVAEHGRLSKLSNEFVKEIKNSLPEAEVSQSLPNMINISVPGILPELLVLALDRAGIMVSAGPACNANKPEPPETPVRFSLGRETTEKDIKQATKVLCQVAQNLLK